jgi:hypothetical protein
VVKHVPQGHFDDVGRTLVGLQRHASAGQQAIVGLRRLVERAEEAEDVLQPTHAVTPADGAQLASGSDGGRSVELDAACGSGQERLHRAQLGQYLRAVMDP